MVKHLLSFLIEDFLKYCPKKALTYRVENQIIQVSMIFGIIGKCDDVASTAGTNQWSTINVIYLINLTLPLTLHLVSLEVSLPANINHNLYTALSGLPISVTMKSWKMIVVIIQR